MLKDKKAVKMLSALAQENRIAIFRLLNREGPDGLAAGEIAEILSVTPATLSFHLSQLENAGLVKATKIGRSIRYSAKYKSIKRLYNYIVEDSYLKAKKKAKAYEDAQDITDSDFDKADDD